MYSYGMREKLMRPNCYYPVIACEQVAETAVFYREYFGFGAVFEAD